MTEHENEQDITELLIAWSDGDEDALEALMPRVVERMHRLADKFLSAERPDHTLQSTALVHEAYLRLVDQDRVRWRDRAHFFAIVGKVMRRILVDHARRRAYQKRGGHLDRAPAEALEHVAADPRDPNFLALDDALDALQKESPESVQILEMRYFGGLEGREIAAVTGLSTPTVSRRLRTARAWLYRYLSLPPDGSPVAMETP